MSGSVFAQTGLGFQMTSNEITIWWEGRPSTLARNGRPAKMVSYFNPAIQGFSSGHPMSIGLLGSA